MTTLIKSKEEVENIIKLVKSLEKLDMLLKSVSEKTENQAKEQKWEFPTLLLGKLAANIIRNMLTGEVVIRGSERKIRADQDF